MRPLAVAVIAGGRSSEREVSLASGASVLAGLREGGHGAELIEIDREGRWLLANEVMSVIPGDGIAGFDVAFPVVHGPFGEDGTLQGLLESLKIPYVGSGVAASALGLDKILAKQRLAQEGVPQVDWVAVTEQSWAADRSSIEDACTALGTPVWVKPARLGSSVGISRVDGQGVVGLGAAIDLALGFDPRVIVEASSGGREVEVSVVEEAAADPGAVATLRISPPGEITLPGAADGDWYDFERKYEAGGMELIVPADLEPDRLSELRHTAARAFAALGCEGYSRVDCFVEGSMVLINEVNTAPGFTTTSVFAQLFAADGLAYSDLLDALLEAALARAERSARYSF